MGQNATKEQRTSHGESSSSAASSSKKPQKSYPSTVDGGALIPQGVYQGEQDYSHDVVKTAIVQRKLMPFYKGEDEEDVYRNQPFNTECPICFLYYPSPLNQTRCCAQPICSECFVQMKRPDPTLTTPPTTHPPECPYCTAEHFGIVYTRPSSSPNQEQPPEASTSSSATTRPQASHGKRKSFSHTDRDVLTVDAVRPDWTEKFAAAQQAVLRRANRRIIMRQVGENLIPIGVTSARAGAELPMGSGPGGAIVLREGERWGGFSGDDNGSGSRRSRNRRGGSGLLGLGMAGQDIEELMLEEAMRLSLLEHEEQQRRQNATNTTSTTEIQDPSQTTASSTAGTSDADPPPRDGVGATGVTAGVARSSSTSRGQPMVGSTSRADRLSQEIRNAPSISAEGSGSNSRDTVQLNPRTSSTFASEHTTAPAPATTATTRTPAVAPPPAASINFGLRDEMLTELAELIDEPSEEMKQRLETAKRSRDAAAAAQSSAPSHQLSRQSADRSALPSAATATVPSSTTSPPASPTAGSARPLNPNNPFRSRMASGQTSVPGTPPSHSRAASGSHAPGPSTASTPFQQQ